MIRSEPRVAWIVLPTCCLTLENNTHISPLYQAGELAPCWSGGWIIQERPKWKSHLCLLLVPSGVSSHFFNLNFLTAGVRSKSGNIDQSHQCRKPFSPTCMFDTPLPAWHTGSAHYWFPSPSSLSLLVSAIGIHAVGSAVAWYFFGIHAPGWPLANIIFSLRSKAKAALLNEKPCVDVESPCFLHKDSRALCS